MLPVTAVCYECQLDGWGRMIATPPHKPPPNVPSGLFECCICYKISHLKCLSNKVSILLTHCKFYLILKFILKVSSLMSCRNFCSLKDKVVYLKKEKKNANKECTILVTLMAKSTMCTSGVSQ